MFKKLTFAFSLLTLGLYSQAIYREYLFNMDSLIVPRVFIYQNENNNYLSYSLQKLIDVDSGFILIQKRYTDSFDIDSSIQFVTKDLSKSQLIEDYWYYNMDNKRYSCKSKHIDASQIDYQKPNNHITKIFYGSCDNHVPEIVKDEAIFKKKVIIILNGKEVECLKYKAQAIFMDSSGRQSKRKGYTYLGKDCGVIRFTNNAPGDKSSWRLIDIKKLK
jgi:hypothetical protein